MDISRNKNPFYLMLAVILLAGCSSPTPASAPVTPTVTVTPASSPTNTPLPAPIIDLAQAQRTATLYDLDFETEIQAGVLDGGAKWSTSLDEDGGHVLCNEISDDWQSLKFGQETWTDYAIEMKVEVLNFDTDRYVEVYTRISSNSTGYRASISDVGTYLAFYPPATFLGESSFPFQSGNWYTLRVEAFGSHIRFYIDDRLVSDATDDQRQVGMAGFGVSPDTLACVDDIRVWALTPDGQIAASAPDNGVITNDPLSIYEGNCVFCFMDVSDPSTPVWDETVQGFQPQLADTREKVFWDDNFSVPAGQTITFENKIIFIRSDHPRNINVFGTLIIKDSLLIWEQTGYSQARLQVKSGATLSIQNSYSFHGNRFWVNWGYEDGSTVLLDHFVGDPWTTINGSVNYTAINFSTVSVTFFSNVTDTNFTVTDSHHVWLELYPPAGTYEITFPTKRQWADWIIPDIWPGSLVSITHSYIYERDISIANDIHVTISDTPSGFSLGWGIGKDTPGYVDCELKNLGDPGNDEGVFYQDTTWDLPCNNSSLTVRNSLLQRAWPVVSGYVHLKVYRSNLADPRNYAAPATLEVYDSTIDLIGAYAGGLVYLENTRIHDDVEVSGSNSIVYAYQVSPFIPGKDFSILKQDGGTYIVLETPGAPWR